jgi:hypothetical protein
MLRKFDLLDFVLVQYRRLRRLDSNQEDAENSGSVGVRADDLTVRAAGF